MANVRMRDVAAALGLSTATVSKVLSGGPYAARFNAETVERVRAAAARMNYVPNRVARNLRARRTYEVGMVLGSAPPSLEAEPYDGRLLLGLSEAAAECGLAAVIVYPRKQELGARDLAPYLDGRIDGVIVRCFVPSDVAFLEGLTAGGLLVVALWRQDVPDGVGYVDVDHSGGMYRAARHLLDLGHRHVAFCIANILDLKNPHFPARYHGYRQALLDAGTTPTSALLVGELAPLLTGPERVTAVCAFNDGIARQVAAVADRAGLHIPGDLSLVGFDNLAESEFVAGGLTTVDHPIREMGREAIRRLVALIDGAPVADGRMVLPTSLVIRHSTSVVTEAAPGGRQAAVKTRGRMPRGKGPL